MAFTKCFECGHDVSTSAAACPNCGAPMKGANPPPLPPPLPSVPPGPVKPKRKVLRTVLIAAGCLLLVLILLSFVGSHTGAPKARTLAAWKAMQRVGYESQTAKAPKGRLDDPPSLKPNIRYMRAKAAGYSQIGLEGVDSILRDHLSHRIALYTRFADILGSEYNDVLKVLQSFQRDAEMRHTFAELIAESDEEKAAAKFAEVFTLLVADDDFKRQVDQIGQQYQPVINEAFEEAQQLDDEETATANALSEKYNVVLKPRYYDDAGINERGYPLNEKIVLRNPQGNAIELKGESGYPVLRNSAFSADGSSLVARARSRSCHL